MAKEGLFWDRLYMVLDNIDDIIVGFVNLFRVKVLGYPDKQEWLDRLAICLECPYSEFGGSTTCKICGCYITAKVKSKSKCPENLW